MPNTGGAVLVDTSPLVALFDPSDRFHADCRKELARLRSQTLFSSLAVVTEASHLLGFSRRAQRALLKWVAAGALEIPEFGAAAVSKAVSLMERYENLPMDFADATLVVLAERLHIGTIFTLDRRDFATYRVGRRALRIIPT